MLTRSLEVQVLREKHSFSLYFLWRILVQQLNCQLRHQIFLKINWYTVFVKHLHTMNTNSRLWSIKILSVTVALTLFQLKMKMAPRSMVICSMMTLLRALISALALFPQMMWKKLAPTSLSILLDCKTTITIKASLKQSHSKSTSLIPAIIRIRSSHQKDWMI